MKQKSSPSYEPEPYLVRAESHSAFSIRPFDPPSSPPPTSPLPPLPEIAPYSHESSPSTLSPIHPIFTMTRPVRPPRPQTSLPDLKPRTITSPETSQRQRHSEIASQARISPTPTSRRQKTLQAEDRSLRLPGRLEPIKSLTLTLTLESATRFSDEVLGALPKLFDRFSLSRSSPNAKREYVEQIEKVEPWRVYHGKLMTSPSKVLNPKKTTEKPVARSALFIPRTPPRKYPRITPAGSVEESSSSMKGGSCYVIQSRKKTLDEHVSPEYDESQSVRQDHPTRACHKRSQAVTSFSFDFGNSYASGSSMISDHSNEKLTSLPRIPSDPILLIDTMSDKQKRVVKVSFSKTPIFYGTSEEVAFAALPYAYTVHSAGPRPRTEKDGRSFDDACDVEVGQEEGRQLTEEQIRWEKRKRILWAIATIALVIISTSGILIGIIWKLKSLT